MENKKIYCGNGKAYGQYGAVGINICLDDIPGSYIQKAKNGKRYLRLNVSPNREPDKYGNTHNLTVNTWQPNNTAQNAQQVFNAKPVSGIQFADEGDGEKIPF